MALYTICGTTKDITARPCAIVEAISSKEALDRAAEMRRSGDLAFLPIQIHLTARRSSRPEVDSFLDFMIVRPEFTTGLGRDEGYSYRVKRLSLAYFQKLWKGKIRPSSKPVGSGGGIEISPFLDDTENERDASTTEEPHSPSQEGRSPSSNADGKSTIIER